MSEGVLRRRNSVSGTRVMKAARRSLEYAIAIGVAILSGYWIVQGRW